MIHSCSVWGITASICSLWLARSSNHMDIYIVFLVTWVSSLSWEKHISFQFEPKLDLYYIRLQWSKSQQYMTQIGAGAQGGLHAAIWQACLQIKVRLDRCHWHRTTELWFVILCCFPLLHRKLLGCGVVVALASGLSWWRKRRESSRGTCPHRRKQG